MAQTATSIGKAYGFFDCKASKAEIEAELPTIRELMQTPSALELSLVEGPENVSGDDRLKLIAKAANRMRYGIEATYRGATNRATADELAMILDQAYQSPLYQEGEQFRGEIVFEENGSYRVRE
jgi:hypothetical protein